MPSPPLGLDWDAGVQGNFVTALCRDTRGCTWVATEDDGVWRCDPAVTGGRMWTQFTQANTHGGLGDDDIYALTCDRLGRIWAGTGRHGVCVFNGKQWRDYDRLTGPLGCHVVALTTSPVDGDVWGATEAGLFRYSLHAHTWTYYTRADGLPSDQADSLAFAKSGTLYVGTLCNGIAIGSPSDDYHTWRVVTGSSTLPNNTPPNTPGGDGLPSPQINCLLVAKSGTVYAGTTTGLAHSNDGGRTWHFLRGADWEGKLAGLEHPENGVWADTDGDLLTEDWVTSLAEDGRGHLWVGHRRTGLECLSEATGRAENYEYPYGTGGYVNALLPEPGGGMLAGTYGDGLVRAAWPDNPALSDPVRVAASYPSFPIPAAPPSLAQLTALLHRVQVSARTAKPLPVGGAVYLGEDWQTLGDWVGRYGRQYAVLCAMNHVITCTNSYSVESVIGPHHSPSDGLRWWVTWLQTDNPKSLYTPVKGVREQAEWDDHGETYPMTYDGPDIWAHVHLGEGQVHQISLYFMNKDGHSSDNCDRDYLIELRRYAPSIAEAETAPVLASARVRDFWGGVYEQFAVHSPGDYWIEVCRNHSFNTILSGVFIDKRVGTQTVTDQEPMAYMNGVSCNPPMVEPLPKSRQAAAASALWASVADGYGDAVRVDTAQDDRLLCYRALQSAHLPAKASLLTDWRWRLGLWQPQDRVAFLAVMAHAREAGVKLAEAKTPAEVAAASK